MTTQGFADLPRDTGIMRRLVSETNGSLGCYAKVVETGQLHVGDAITFC
jgi:MOSC domain-containing protein YiiM